MLVSIHHRETHCCILISPRLSDMRKVGSTHGAVTAYPRQLESLIRLAEAHAKMRFSQVVEIADVEEAKRCVCVCVCV